MGFFFVLVGIFLGFFGGDFFSFCCFFGGFVFFRVEQIVVICLCGLKNLICGGLHMWKYVVYSSQCH